MHAYLGQEELHPPENPADGLSTALNSPTAVLQGYLAHKNRGVLGGGRFLMGEVSL